MFIFFFSVFDTEIATLAHLLTNLRYLDIRELKIEQPTGVLSQLRSTRLERVFLQLYVRDTEWNEIESVVEQNPAIQSLRFSVRGRFLRNEDTLLIKIADHLKTTLTELDLHNFSAEKGPLSYLLITCRNLKKLRLTGSMQFDVDAMIRVQQICQWEIFELAFQVTPPRETYDALQYLPRTIAEISYVFGPSNRAMIVSSIASLPALRRIRYHTEFFNDALVNNLLASLNPEITRRLECLDIGVCDALTDAGLDAVADSCPNLKEFYLHSDTAKANRVATCSSLCRWFDRPLDAPVDGSRLRVLYFNYFKALSSDFLQIVAVECPNLEELHLASVRCVNDGLLKIFAQHCSKLNTIDVMNCWAVTDRGIIALAERLPLINLNVGMCFKLTNACVLILAACCPFLERFVYHGAPKLKRSPAVVQLQRSCEKRLKTHWYQWNN